MHFRQLAPLYKNKSPYNPSDILLDTLASIRQEKLDGIAQAICYRVARHYQVDQLTDEQVIQFDDLIRPLIMASRLQRLCAIKITSV
ncbi:putative 3-dehydroquinate synthase [Roseibium sp. TrichSKD4]|nr:putative 3-dehydroquinate synthase [Roseibium sp. TrichSKD4]